MKHHSLKELTFTTLADPNATEAQWLAALQEKSEHAYSKPSKLLIKIKKAVHWWAGIMTVWGLAYSLKEALFIFDSPTIPTHFLIPASFLGSFFLGFKAGCRSSYVTGIQSGLKLLILFNALVMFHAISDHNLHFALSYAQVVFAFSVFLYIVGHCCSKPTEKCSHTCEHTLRQPEEQLPPDRLIHSSSQALATGSIQPAKRPTFYNNEQAPQSAIWRPVSPLFVVGTPYIVPVEQLTMKPDPLESDSLEEQAEKIRRKWRKKTLSTRDDTEF